MGITSTVQPPRSRCTVNPGLQQPGRRLTRCVLGWQRREVVCHGLVPVPHGIVNTRRLHKRAQPHGRTHKTFPLRRLRLTVLGVGQHGFPDACHRAMLARQRQQNPRRPTTQGDAVLQQLAAVAAMQVALPICSAKGVSDSCTVKCSNNCVVHRVAYTWRTSPSRIKTRVSCCGVSRCSSHLGAALRLMTSPRR